MNTAQIECEIAREYGAECIPDPKRGGSFCKFEIAGWTIWECVFQDNPPKYPSGHVCRVGWQCAALIDGRYQQHTPFAYLEQALKFATSNLTHYRVTT